jgi:hypothetical protein
MSLAYAYEQLLPPKNELRLAAGIVAGARTAVAASDRCLGVLARLVASRGPWRDTGATAANSASRTQ